MKYAPLIWCCAALLTGSQAKADAPRPVVVELFTSQGCSSCPPADAYLRELAKRGDVLALSLHVDYWDNLGWKDTLGSPAFTTRQMEYKTAMKLHGVYTPQIIIDGVSEGIGSRSRDIDTKIRARAASLVDVPMDARRDGNMLRLEIGAGAKPAAPAIIWLVRYTKEESVRISRGENSGTTIAYANVVRDMHGLGTWTGAAMNVALPKLDGGSYAVLLQTGEAGPILGAARISRSP
jgi:hypothetical protein